MANVKAFYKTTKKGDPLISLRFRLRDNANGRQADLYYKSDIKMNKSLWNEKKQSLNSGIKDEERTELLKRISDLKNTILEVYAKIKYSDNLTSELFSNEIDSILNPVTSHEKAGTLPDVFELFVNERKISYVRKKNYRVVIRALRRFELYEKLSDRSFELTFDGLSVSVLKQFEKFLTAEPELYKKHPEIYREVPESRPPKPRGQNTLNSIFSKLRTFILWANDEGLMTENPFRKFKIENCIYGTPYYITIDERNQLYNTDLSEWPELAIQRDIFIFQCMIGCRVGDLLKFTKKNVIKGAIEYIPRKTREGRPVTVRVPLNKTAKEILNRYKDYDCPGLLPFVNTQKYNKLIKEIFTHAEITRMVTVINPTSREPEQQPLNVIASSHLARRTFVGNLYKQVKDPNLISALSGHSENSRAFARYRNIDEQMKIDLVKKLE